MFDVEKFKSNLGGQSTKELVDYIIKNKICLKEDAVNVIIKSRLERNKWPKPSNAKKIVEYFLRIGFIKENGDSVELNNNFKPLK